jgi:hypothetical protein
MKSPRFVVAYLKSFNAISMCAALFAVTQTYLKKIQQSLASNIFGENISAFIFYFLDRNFVSIWAFLPFLIS